MIFDGTLNEVESCETSIVNLLQIKLLLLHVSFLNLNLNTITLLCMDPFKYEIITSLYFLRKLKINSNIQLHSLTNSNISLFQVQYQYDNQPTNK